MSVNYHAFQSRGILFAESGAVCEQWRTRFRDFDPERIARILHLERDRKYLYIPYYGVQYRLRLADGCLEKKQKEDFDPELYFNESMAVYHLLFYTRDLPVISGKWIPSHRVDGVVARNYSLPDPLLDPFAKRYRLKLEELQEACEKAGGRKLEEGDLSYEFEAFPCIRLRLVFWDEDEDFPAQAQILVDANITDFVHYETVGCMISDLLERLEQQEG